MKKSIRTTLLLSVFALAALPCALADTLPSGTEPIPGRPTATSYIEAVVFAVLNMVGL
jgi:hypothetical protein